MLKYLVLAALCVCAAGAASEGKLRSVSSRVRGARTLYQPQENRERRSTADTTTKRARRAEDDAPMDQLYDKLDDLFGPRGEAARAEQRFVMEFPARVLTKEVYEYPIEDAFSTLKKPLPVAEAEFHLSDLLIPFGVNTCGGPSGKRLSTLYNKILNDILPYYIDQEFMEDQAKMRQWLLTEIDYTPLQTIQGGSVVNVEPIKVNRMTANSALTEEWLAQKLAYEQNKTARFLKAWEETRAASEADGETKNAALDAYTREITNEAPIRVAQVDKYYDDLVARGYYHEIRRILDYLDVTNLASLQKKLKDNMRNSAKRSLDGTTEWYPVSYQPARWSASLSTDFQPVDLLTDPVAIHTQLFQLYDLRDQKLAQLGQATALKTGNVEDLKKEVENARTALDSAHTELTSAYTDNVIFAVKTAIKYYKKVNPLAQGVGTFADYQNYAATNAASRAGVGGVGIPDIDESDWEGIAEGFQKVDNAQNNLQKANRALSEKMAALALAKASDHQGAVAALQQEVAGLDRKIKFTEDQLLAPGVQLDFKNTTTDDDGNTVADVEKDVSKQSSVPSGEPVGPWTTVIMSFTSSTTRSSSSRFSSASQRTVKVNLFFASYSKSSSSSFASASQSMSASSNSFELGLRATKVTFVRGWFDPTIFAFANEMFAIRPTNEPYSGILPEYPIAFVIVKDVSLKITATSSLSTSFGRESSKQSASSGGFWVFSASSSSSSSSSYQSSYSASTGSTFMIRIPGPQVMGWIVQIIQVHELTTAAAPSRLPDGYLPDTQAILNGGGD